MHAVKTESKKIIDLLSHTFEKNAWHGPAVLEVLAEVSPEMAVTRIGESHSIIELVAHMTAWRNFVSEKLEGNTEFDLSESQNFPQATNWKTVLADLKQSQQRLLNALTQMPDERLQEKVPNRPFKFYTMLHGIIHHDLYHIGQIVLIKKSIANVRK